MIINCDTDRFVRDVIEGNEYSFMFHDLTVVDVGCNIGTFSMWIYPLAKIIYAIDFSQENIDKLNENIAKNDLKRIKSFCFGIGSYSGERYVERTGIAGGGSWHFAGKSDFVVQTYTLNNFMSHEYIEYVDVLKIDVEGAEMEILSEMDFPFKRVGCIVGESHGQGTSQAIRNILDQNGYKWSGTDTHFVARKR